MDIKAMEKEKRFQKIRSKIPAAILLLLFLLFSVNLIRSYFMLSKGSSMLDEAQNKLYAEEEKKRNLEKELAKVESREYIEKQLREKLNMVKEGEIVILGPTPFVYQEPTPTPIDRSSNIEKWRKVFF